MQDKMTIEEIGAKMDALGAWGTAMPCHWALKPRGCAFPYFCSTLKGENPIVKVRFLLLEGWQTFHDYVRTRIDRDFGFYSLPMEFPHFELVILHSGEMKLFRNDPGYVPREATERERTFCSRMLWEAYGVLLRLETDKRLPMMFADEKAMFARVEDSSGVWHDEPVEIPQPRPYVEQVNFSKQAIVETKDLPLNESEVLELDLRIIPGMMTRENRPRILYVLGAVDAQTGAVVFRDKLSVDGETGLRGLWESFPSRVLAHFVERKAVPGNLHVMTGRAFRLMRPLCIELPFKLTKVATLPHFNAVLRNLV